MADLTEARSEAGGVVWERQALPGACVLRAGTAHGCGFRPARQERPRRDAVPGLAPPVTASIIPARGTYHFDFTDADALPHTGAARSITTSITAPRRRRSSKSTTCRATTRDPWSVSGERFGSWATLQASLLRIVHGAMSAAICAHVQPGGVRHGAARADRRGRGSWARWWRGSRRERWG